MYIISDARQLDLFEIHQSALELATENLSRESRHGVLFIYVPTLRSYAKHIFHLFGPHLSVFLCSPLYTLTIKITH